MTSVMKVWKRYAGVSLMFICVRAREPIARFRWLCHSSTAQGDMGNSEGWPKRLSIFALVFAIVKLGHLTRALFAACLLVTASERCSLSSSMSLS
ncbi:hypothetical protein F5B18DRAFT_360328 [Nemania serpens]|nr:hypothetical protein F5B18DRAFT_360328 [Nemania serpens]